MSASPEDLDLRLRTRFCAGDPQAFRDVYDQHSAALYTFAKRAIGPERGQDITQEVFLSAWRARTSYNPTKGGLGGWLMGIMKNRLVDTYRMSGRRVAEAELSESVTSMAGADNEEQLDQLADQLLLASAFQALSDRQQTVLRMAFWEGLTQQQISERTGWPLGTVKSDTRRGLLRLRGELERNDD